MKSETIEVKKDDLRGLFQVLTNYPAISKEQVQNEMYKVFGEDAFKPQDVTERVKTFEDACRELGEDHPFVSAYNELLSTATRENFLIEVFGFDTVSFMKLRIICAALNEGWEPQFTEDEWRWFPWFTLWTKEELSQKSNEWKSNRSLIFIGDKYRSVYAGLAYARSSYAPSLADANFGSRLCLKSESLATYCGKQFIDIWADFYLIRKCE